MFLVEVCGEVYTSIIIIIIIVIIIIMKEKSCQTRDMGLSLRRKPHDRSLSHFDTIPACSRDRRTDRRRTDLLQ